MGYVWSVMQKAIFTKLTTTTSNIFINAVAGSGKTTTIMECTKLVNGKSVFLAFNKAIADDLGKRGANAKTFHSLCMQPVIKYKNATLDVKKMGRLFGKIKSSGSDYAYMKHVLRMVSIAKNNGVGCEGYEENTTETWEAIIKHHSITLESKGSSVDRLIYLASRLLDESINDAHIDFDDMLYYIVLYNIDLPKYDVIFVDEAQDTNSLQRVIIKKMMNSKSRIVAVGDPSQSIYGFRGADSEAVSTLIKEFNCELMPLSVTYRCSKQVTNYAQQWVKEIIPRDGADEGVVSELPGWGLDIFTDNDMILCRTTKPLVALGMQFYKKRIPAKIAGKDIGDGMKELVAKFKAKSLHDLHRKVTLWKNTEVNNAKLEGDVEREANVTDKADAIFAVIEGLPQNKATVDDVTKAIDVMFDQNIKAVTLSTIHKAKGMESDNIFWLNRSACPSSWAKNDWQKVQERNLCYVAATRAKHNLFLIEDKDMVL